MARERYLLNADEDTIHENVIELRSKKDIRKNWWYYNKVKVLVGILLAAVVAYFVYSVFFTVKPDYTIAVVNQISLDQSALDIMGDHIADYGEDLNGDGKVIVNVVNYSVDTAAAADPSYAQALQAFYVKFAGDMSSGDSMIWLHDLVGYKQIGEDADGMFEKLDAENTTGNGTMLDITEIPGLNNIDYSGYTDGMVFTPENIKEINSALRLSIREVEGSNIERSEKLTKYHDDCERLFQNLLTDTKVSSNGVPLG